MVFFRRRLSFSSSSSSFDSDLSTKDENPALSYFNGDPELTIYSQTSVGYGVLELVDILMSNSLSEGKVCKIQPFKVNRNSTFVIDLDSVAVEDLKADDLGSWKLNGTRR